MSEKKENMNMQNKNLKKEIKQTTEIIQQIIKKTEEQNRALRKILKYGKNKESFKNN